MEQLESFSETELKMLFHEIKELNIEGTVYDEYLDTWHPELYQTMLKEEQNDNRAV